MTLSQSVSLSSPGCLMAADDSSKAGVFDESCHSSPKSRPVVGMRPWLVTFSLPGLPLPPFVPLEQARSFRQLESKKFGARSLLTSLMEETLIRRRHLSSESATIGLGGWFNASSMNDEERLMSFLERPFSGATTKADADALAGMSRSGMRSSLYHLHQ